MSDAYEEYNLMESFFPGDRQLFMPGNNYSDPNPLNGVHSMVESIEFKTDRKHGKRPLPSNESQETEAEEHIFPVYSAQSQHDMNAMVLALAQVIGSTHNNPLQVAHENPLNICQSNTHGQDQSLLAQDRADSGANVHSNSKAAMSSVERKRMKDKAYRQRRKEDFKRAEKELDTLRKENADLKGEIEHLKMGIAQYRETGQIHDEEKKKLEKSYEKLKEDYDSKATILKVLSEKLVAGSSGIALQRKNAQLENEISGLMAQINDPYQKLQMLQFEEKNASLEREVMMLKTTVGALCAMINKDRHGD